MIDHCCCRIVFGRNNSLSSRPRLNLMLNNKAVVDKAFCCCKDGEENISNKEVFCYSNTEEVLPSSLIISRLLKDVVRCYKGGSGETAACKAARLALRCTIRSNVNNMQGWQHYSFLLETSTEFLIVCIVTFSSNTHTYPTRHATRRNCS